MTWQRWWTWLAFVVLVLVAVTAATSAPHVGWHGASLGLTLAIAGFVAGALGIRAAMFAPRAGQVHGAGPPDGAEPADGYARSGMPGRPRVPRPIFLAALALLAVSCTALGWLQPAGPGLGLAIGTGTVLAARTLPLRFGSPARGLAACLAALAVAYALGFRDHHKAVTFVGLLPFAGVFLLAVMMWRLRVQQERADRMMALMAETRDAELRAAALAERQRLAREMHDVLAHSLSGLVVQLEGARLMIAADRSDDRLAGVVDRAHQLAKNGLDEARAAIGMLRDDELPGPERIAGLTGRFAADTGIPCQFTLAGQPRELASTVRLALYRVAQEALTNMSKHAHPERAEVRLEYGADTVTLAVEDFGSPPTPEPAPSVGYGLGGMRERAELLGGALIAGPTSAGFLVRLAVPA